MIQVRLTDAVLPGNFGIGNAAREKDVPVSGPGGEIRAASFRGGGTIGGGEPHGHAAGQDAMFGAVRFADADIAPVVAGIRAREAIDVEHPLIVGRPTGAEEEVSWLALDFLAISAGQVAGPNLIAFGRGQMKGDPLTVVAETESVGQAFTRLGKVADAGAVEIHADDLSDLVLHDLHEKAVVADKQCRSFKGSDAVLGAEFFQRAADQIVDPDVRRCLSVVLVERPSRSVAARFHAQKDDAASVREQRTGLPGGLIGDVEVKSTSVRCRRS